MSSRVPNLLVLSLFMLFPSLVGVTGGAKDGQRLLHVVTVPVLLMLSLAGFRLRRVRARKTGIIPTFLVTWSLFAVIAIVQAGGHLGLGGLLDVFRPILYACYLVLPLVFPLSKREMKQYVGILVGLTWLQLAFSATVYVPALDVIQNVFKGRPSWDPVRFHYFRWSGLMAWPADFAFYLSLFLYFAYFRVASSEKNSSDGNLRYWLLGVGSAAGIIMTMSRGGLAAAAVMLVLAMIWMRRIQHLLVFGGIAAIIAVPFVTGVFEDTPEFRSSYVTGLLERDEELDASAAHRVGELSFALGSAAENFPLGLGPNRDAIDSHIRVVESLYGHYLSKWGILGLTLYLLSVLLTIRALFSVRRELSDDPNLYAFVTAMILWVISVPLVWGWSSAITDRFKCLPFYYLTLGQVLAIRTDARHRYEQGNAVLRSVY